MSTTNARRENAPTMTNNEDEDNEVVLWQDLEERETVEIPIVDDSSSIITLRQYISSDDRWGIHSSVWEGGLALLAYLQQHPVPKDTLIVDLGSGTGIVGLGLTKLGYTKVAVTDLQEALPLLDDNVQRNEVSDAVQVCNLTWGEPLSKQVLNLIQNSKRVLCVGADIVYRQSLFAPLIATLAELLQYEHVSCLLASHSIRTHLPKFYQCLLESSSIDRVDLVATVSLPAEKTTAVTSSKIQMVTKVPLDEAPRETSLVHIANVISKKD
jgi:predicted nicotinamide N-methyase